jgi:hypothetical protein
MHNFYCTARPKWIKSNKQKLSKILASLEEQNTQNYSYTIYTLFYMGIKFCLFLQGKNRLTAFENKALRRTFGPRPRRQELTGGRR